MPYCQWETRAAPYTELMSLEWSTSLGRWVGAALVLCCGLPVIAQPLLPRIDPLELAEVYAELRFRKEFARAVGAHGRLVPPREMDHVAVPSDTLGAWILRQAYDYARGEPDWAGRVSRWRMIAADSSEHHRREYASTEWAFLGANQFTALDTTATPVLRAYLEGRFGPPTRTLATGTGAPAEQAMQFEYWFQLNDSIRVMVMDATGPLDRGIIFAGDQRYRDYLFNLRQSFLGDLLLHEEPAPYIDYYYSPVSEWWYRTGYDGETFFTERIQRPRLEDGPPKLSSRN